MVRLLVTVKDGGAPPVTSSGDWGRTSDHGTRVVVKAVFGSEEGEEAPAIDEDALHLPRRRAAAASATWQYLLLETSRKLVWTVPASARERVYGPSAALLLGPAGSRERERSRRATSRRRSLGESRRACSRSFSTALMAVLAPTQLLPETGRVSKPRKLPKLDVAGSTRSPALVGTLGSPESFFAFGASESP